MCSEECTCVFISGLSAYVQNGYVCSVHTCVCNYRSGCPRVGGGRGDEAEGLPLGKSSQPHSSVGKESACNAEDPGSIPGLGGSTGEGIVYPLQYSLTSLVVQLVKNPLAMWETWV